MTDDLIAIWWAGVRAVTGDRAVAAALTARPVDRPDRIVAVGKAAPAMAAAAAAAYPGVPVLVITKYGHAAGADLPGDAEILEAAHPVPDQASLGAGTRLLDCVAGMARGTHLMMLVSGGASALVEVPETGLTLADLAARNARLLADGLDIGAMNAERRKWSRIKGGRLMAAFPGARATVLAVSDVEGDGIGVIGSGIGMVPGDADYESETRIVASNAIARAAAAAEAEARGHAVLSSEETLYCDVAEAADRIAARLDATPGVRIWGGEPTVVLPEAPGEGGRNQALALEVARRIGGMDRTQVLVAGTDGSDGPTAAAGGLVDGTTWGAGAAEHLAAADAGTFLRARGALFETGPTGTNVMDLAVALRW